MIRVVRASCAVCTAALDPGSVCESPSHEAALHMRVEAGRFGVAVVPAQHVPVASKLHLRASNDIRPPVCMVFRWDLAPALLAALRSDDASARAVGR